MPPLPPHPCARVAVGITGHRATRLPAGAEQWLPAALEAVLRALAAAATPAVPVLHTPLATGADQIAAIAARAAGYRIEALLPFAPQRYAADFTAGAEREAFAQALCAADGVTALAGDGGDVTAAYVAVGKAVIAASDVLIAVWDGVRDIVPGGTAHVVALALTAGRPVIHIDVFGGGEGEGPHPPRLVVGDDAAAGATALAGPGDYARLIAGLPPRRACAQPPPAGPAPTIAARS